MLIMLCRFHSSRRVLLWAHSGNSNTRWVNGPPCIPPTAATREPPVPWCGLLWPDGMPVSFTEAAAVRRYLGGDDDFLAFDDFLPPISDDEADQYLTLTPGPDGTGPYSPPISGQAPPQRDRRPVGLAYEMAFWLSNTSSTVRFDVLQTLRVEANASMLHAARLGPKGLVTAEKTVPATAIDSGIILGGWNLLRVTLTAATTGDSNRTVSAVYLNPTAHPTMPTLGSVTPRLTLTTAGTPQPDARVAVSAVAGTIRLDYFSILPVESEQR